jgi:histone-lysine N-methyltransferase SETD1
MNRLRNAHHAVARAFAVKRSAIDGKGLFAASALPARKKLGELTGQIISDPEARRRVRGKRRISMVELADGGVLDATADKEFRYANHSCTPNAYIRVYRTRVEYYALRDIKPGEEITADYGETQHNGTLPCRCGGERCRGYL